MAQRTVKLGGNPIPVAGEELEVGQKAPDFALVANDLSPVTLKDTTGKVRIVAVVHSLDTGVCDRETRRFNQEASKLLGLEVYVVSVDLPFAQKRWCGAAGIERVHTLSDHRAATFERWGVLIPAARLLARATFVLDQDDVVRYAEYLPDVGQEPSYDAVLEAARKLL